MKNFPLLPLLFLTGMTEFGRKKANPHACYTNNLKLDRNPCACTNDKVCQETFSGTLNTAATLVAATFDGVRYTTAMGVENLAGEQLHKPAVILANDAKAMDKFLRMVYNTKEFDPYCGVTITGTTVEVVHIGACELTSLEFDNNGTPVVWASPVRCCEIAAIKDFRLSVVDAVPDFSYNGSAHTPTPATYAWTGVAATDTATAATLKAQVEAALTALGVQFNTVTVTVNNVIEAYEIAYHSSNTTPITSNAVPFVECDSYEGFVCP